MKLCINCKHYLADPAFPEHTRFSRCGFDHPKSLVDGQPIAFDLLPYCSVNRKYKDTCSIEAINFEEATNV